MNEKKKVVLLGATGSVGSSALKVIAARSDRFELLGISGNTQTGKLAEIARKFHVPHVATADPARLGELRAALPECKCSAGAPALRELASLPEADIVLCAIVGTGGLFPVLDALKLGRRIALASKEIMVMAGELVNACAAPDQITPVDSEHAALHQCLDGRDRAQIKKLILTASGGPFRTTPAEKIACATVAEALNHPTWSMGRKITIDSASMMNKALELIEAKHLFHVSGDKLGILIHPQSRVHALIEMMDGTFIAQVGHPDMQLPAAYALSYPERLELPMPEFDWQSCPLTFFEPDRVKFPSFDFADAALKTGGTLPAVMNAANEVAVERFLKGEIPFGGIWKIVGSVMEHHNAAPQQSIEQLIAVDAEAKAAAKEIRL